MIDFFGLRCPDTRHSVWMNDPSVDWESTPQEARTAYLRDGEARHLRLKEGAPPPTRIVLRPLTAEERAIVQSRCRRLEHGESRHYAMLELLMAFAVGCDLPDLPDEVDIPGRGKVPKWEVEDGVRRLSRGLTDWINATQGEPFWLFYGRLVLEGSRARPEDFFQSSQASTAPKNLPTLGTATSGGPPARNASAPDGSASAAAPTSA